MSPEVDGAVKVVFVTNICPHYRVKTFETLAKYHSLRFYFFSAGNEWYWQQKHGKRSGAFDYQYLPGINVAGTRFTPSLPYYLFRDDYDVMIKCITGRFALPVSYAIARLRHKPLILWTGIWTRLQTRFHRLIFPLTRFIYRHADAVVVYGQHVKDFLISEGVDGDRIFVAPHAVDNQLYSARVTAEQISSLRKQLGITPEQRVILYLGRLEAVKGLHHLLDAFARLSRPNVVLMLVGEGSEKSALQKQAESLKVSDKVIFVPYVVPDQTAPYYALAYALVLPSVTMPQGKELWGLVINEAMNQGTPAVVTDAVGAAAGGMVQNGRNGLVVPEGDANSLTIALQQLVDDPGFRERLSRNARETIAAWDNEAMVKGFRDAIRYVLNGKGVQACSA